MMPHLISTYTLRKQIESLSREVLELKKALEAADELALHNECYLIDDKSGQWLTEMMQKVKKYRAARDGK